jgi:hypothetical protein
LPVASALAVEALSPRDITERIAETPKCSDENGVPRYGEFEPRRAANIYAVEVVLLDIACSMCL